MLDFYRGTLSGRRLRVLIEQLPIDSALNRALNDGQPPLTRSEHFIADLWSLWAKKEHPVRAEIEHAARIKRKRARVIHLRTRYQKLKRTYGLG